MNKTTTKLIKFASLVLQSERRELEIVCDQFFSPEFRCSGFLQNLDAKCQLIAEASRLIMLFPEYCLKNSYVDIVAEHLSDASPQVRLACLEVLDQRLYCNSSLSSPSSANKRETSNLLAQFTDRIKDRLFDLVYDDDMTVASSAIGMLSKINVMLPDCLGPKYQLPICLFASSTTDPRAKPAVSFLHEHVKLAVSQQQAFNNCPDLSPSDDSDPDSYVLLDISSPNEPRFFQLDGSETLCDKTSLAYIAKLGNFVGRFGTASNVSRLVANLWPICPAIRDWSAFVYLLANYQRCNLENFFGVARLLVCSAFHVMENFREAAIAAKNKPNPNVESLQEQCRLMTEILMPSLPRLIRVCADVSMVQSPIPVFLELVQLNVLFYYRSMQDGSAAFRHFQELVRCLCEIFQHQSLDFASLDSIAKVFKIFVDESFLGGGYTRAQFSRMANQMKASIVAAIDALNSKAATMVPAFYSSSHNSQMGWIDDAAPHCSTITSLLTKFSTLAAYFDLTELALEHQCVAILRLFALKAIPFQQILEAALGYAGHSLSWLVATKLAKAADANSAEIVKEQLTLLIRGIQIHLVSILRQPELSHLSRYAIGFLNHLQASYPALYASASSAFLLSHPETISAAPVSSFEFDSRARDQQSNQPVFVVARATNSSFQHQSSSSSCFDASTANSFSRLDNSTAVIGEIPRD